MAKFLSSASVAPLSRVRSVRLPALMLATTALVAGTGFAGGGYFPSSWGWPALAAGWAAALVLAVDRQTALGRLPGLAAALLVLLTAWTAIGAAWSRDESATLLEAERTAVYAAAVLAALVWVRRNPQQILYGVWLASVLLCGWGLITRLVPDRFGVVDAISGYRLSEPIGYWNSLGLLAAIGTLLALGLAAGAPRLFGRVLAAASVPVLVATLFFTYSRGAWVALAAGLAVAIAVERQRLRLIAVGCILAAWATVGVWRAATSPALTTWGSPLHDMARQGHRLGIVIVVVSAAAAVAVAAVAALEPTVELGPRTRRALGGLLLVAAVGGLAIVFVTQGSPATLARRAWNGFSTGSVQSSGSLNNRLFHLSGNGRTRQWSVAWRDARAHPWLGSGAGTYEIAWFRDRPVALKVRDAHNLYLETLAELGPVGLLLLVGGLVLPLVAGLRARRRPLAAVALGAYVAYLLHAAVDWDWEIVSVTLAALLCGTALLAEPGRPLARPQRWVALATALVLSGVGVYTVAEQVPLSNLRTAAAHGHWGAAERNARNAARIAPWSEEPWLTLGRDELAAGRLTHARAALKKAVAKSPSDWLAWVYLARASRGQARAHALSRASALNPLAPELVAFRNASA